MGLRGVLADEFELSVHKVHEGLDGQVDEVTLNSFLYDSEIDGFLVCNFKFLGIHQSFFQKRRDDHHRIFVIGARKLLNLKLGEIAFLD